jgi:hypothetical protein
MVNKQSCALLSSLILTSLAHEVWQAEEHPMQTSTCDWNGLHHAMLSIVLQAQLVAVIVVWRSQLAEKRLGKAGVGLYWK